MRYRFGTFEFDSAVNELRKAGRLVKLERQPGIVLEHLLANPGAIVTRDALRQAVWGGHVHVDFDRGLAYCISQIRTALGDQADNSGSSRRCRARGFGSSRRSRSSPPRWNQAATSRLPRHDRLSRPVASSQG